MDSHLKPDLELNPTTKQLESWVDSCWSSWPLRTPSYGWVCASTTCLAFGRASLTMHAQCAYVPMLWAGLPPGQWEAPPTWAFGACMCIYVLLDLGSKPDLQENWDLGLGCYTWPIKAIFQHTLSRLKWSTYSPLSIPFLNIISPLDSLYCLYSTCLLGYLTSN